MLRRTASSPQRWRAAALRARVQPLVRDGLARVLAAVGATRPRRFARGALTVVTFHRVLPAERLRHYPLSGLAVTPEQLEQILGQLAQHFACSPLIGAYRRWQSEPRAARPLLAITFDDGSLDNYEHARAVLDRLGLKASFYIPVALVEERRCPWHDRLGFALLRSVAVLRKRRDVDFAPLLAPFGLSPASYDAVLPADAVSLAAQGVAVAKQLGADARERAIDTLERVLGGDQVPDWAGLMSWQQIRELGAQGHEIGSHSLTHPLLTDLGAEQLADEVVLSRTRLAQAAGCEVASFCYPNGSYDARALEAVRAAGYTCAVTTRWGLNRHSASSSPANGSSGGGRTGNSAPGNSAPGNSALGNSALGNSALGNSALGNTAAYELNRCDMDYARLQSRHGEFSAQRLWLRLSGLQPGLAAPSAY